MDSISRTSHNRSGAFLGHILEVFGLSILACVAPSVAFPVDTPTAEIILPSPSNIMSTRTVIPTSTEIAMPTVLASPMATLMLTRTPSRVAPLPTMLLSSTPMVYKVKQGDTLVKIAQRLCGDQAQWVRLARLNGLERPDEIQVGQILIVECDE